MGVVCHSLIQLVKCWYGVNIFIRDIKLCKQSSEVKSPSIGENSNRGGLPKLVKPKDSGVSLPESSKGSIQGTNAAEKKAQHKD